MSARVQPEVPVTQIIYFRISSNSGAKLEDDGLWAEALDCCEQSTGFMRLYWGRSHEHSQHAQLHTVRESFGQHQDFLNSNNYKKFLSILIRLAGQAEKPVIRHAQLRSWSPDDPSLGRGAPYVGTAIYLNTTDAWDEGAWPLWTHTVRHIDGCLGGAGGPLLEPVETIPGPFAAIAEGGEEMQRFQRCNIVFVAWESTEKHHNYHHTRHFAKHGVILQCGNDGWAEYGHVVFEGSREKAVQAAAKL